MKAILSLAGLLIAAASFAAGTLWARQQTTAAPLESHIIRAAAAKRSGGTWGDISIYTAEGTMTVGTRSMLVAELEFRPGQRLQPPHRHEDEELQYVISGSGTWHLNGEDIPLQTGDLMYAKPGDLHGIANTGSAPLRFLVVKWVSHGTR